jgi:hypothetical protein
VNRFLFWCIVCMIDVVNSETKIRSFLHRGRVCGGIP